MTPQDPAILEAIFQPYLAPIYTQATTAFVHTLLLNAGLPSNHFQAVQPVPACPWWAYCVGKDGRVTVIDRRDPRVQVQVAVGTSLVDLIRELLGRETDGTESPAFLEGQSWYLSHGQTALVIQINQARMASNRGHAVLLGEGTVLLNPEREPRWSSRQEVEGRTIEPVVLLHGPSPWGRDVPWVNWSALGRMVEEGAVRSAGDLPIHVSGG